MSIYKAYKTDSSLENQGARIVKGANDDGSEIVFYVGRAGKSNTSYKLASERAFKPHRQALKSNTLTNEVAENLLLDLFCGHILKGWENVYSEDGSPLAFNETNAKKLMTDLPDLYQELSDSANETSNFLDANRETEAKN